MRNFNDLNPNYVNVHVFDSYVQGQNMTQNNNQNKMLKIETELDMIKKLILRGEIDDLKQDIIGKNDKLEKCIEDYSKRQKVLEDIIKKKDDIIKQLECNLDSVNNKYNISKEDYKDLFHKYEKLSNRFRDFVDECKCAKKW